MPNTILPPSAQEALERLKSGNFLYQKSSRNPASLSEELRQEAAEQGQDPYATIIACSDSRVAVEHIFSVGLGALFVVRTAGNIVGKFELGSVEYSLQTLGVPLVLVLGHIGCGAIKASMKGQAPDNPIMQEITPIVEDADSVRDAERLNVINSIENLFESPVVRDLVGKGRLAVVGGMYDIESGAVYWQSDGLARPR